MYGREYGDRVLNFEASGALLDASLVMRDRETDSWWSIMSSDAIGGALEGTRLVELPGSEKTTWGDWVRRHPETQVLSVDGSEHELRNPYDEYFRSDKTFRDQELADPRLAAKAPIWSFRIDGRPFAIAHQAIGDGRVLELPGTDGEALYLYRETGAGLIASTRAFRLDTAAARIPLLSNLRERAARGEFDPYPGFDTFWYSWVAVNPDTVLLGQ